MATPRTRALDWLAGVAGLLGGSLLLARHERRLAAATAPARGEAELDDTARDGRGRAQAPLSQASRAAGHETQDADVRGVARALAVLAVLAAGSVLGLLGLLAWFHVRLEASRPPTTPEQSTLVEPPRPRLETNPGVDLHRENAAEATRSADYAWLDPTHTRARIPIARAMVLAVGRPLDAAP